MSPPPLIYTPPSQKCVEIAIGIITRGVRMDRGFKLSFSFADFSLDYMQKGGKKSEKIKRVGFKKIYWKNDGESFR